MAKTISFLLKLSVRLLALVAAIVLAAFLFLHVSVLWYRLAWYRQDPLPAASIDVPGASSARSFAIVGATLIDGKGGPPLENSTVLVCGERICNVGKAGQFPVPPEARRIDATGKFILPGLIDMHVHLNKGDSLELFLAAGVTTVRDLADSTDWVRQLRQWTETNQVVGPRIFYAGEALNKLNGDTTAAQAVAEVQQRIANGASVIKIVNDTRPDLVAAVVQEAHRLHTPVTADLFGNLTLSAAQGIALGLDGIEHLSGVPRSIQAGDALPLSRPVDALYGWLDKDERKEAALVAEIVRRGTYMTPTFAMLEAVARVPRPGDPGAQYLAPRLKWYSTASEYLSRFDPGRQTAFAVHYTASRAFIAKVAAAGGRITAGTDTPTPGVTPGYSLHRELELLANSGLTPMGAIQAATRTAAECLGRSADLGTIEPGKLADLLVTAGSPSTQISDIRRLELVFKGGVAFEPSRIIMARRGVKTGQ